MLKNIRLGDIKCIAELIFILYLSIQGMILIVFDPITLSFLKHYMTIIMETDAYLGLTMLAIVMIWPKPNKA